MTSFSGNTFASRKHDNRQKQMERLQEAVLEASGQLEEVREEERRAEEHTLHLTNELKKRMDLMMDHSEVVDALQQLGLLRQRERQLSERLKCPGSAERKQMRELQERGEHVTNKVRSLVAEIEEVKQHLAESEPRSVAADALIGQPTTKSKKQRKSK